FYDAIAPIVSADSVDMGIAFRGARSGQDAPPPYSDAAPVKETPAIPMEHDGEEGDYLNCPMTRQEYEDFYQALREAERVPAHDFEKEKHFEGCMPIEALADRGERTLAFGPLKPVGFTDPRTGRRPWALLQLRAENAARTSFNLVGCQTKMTHGAQDRVFRLVPGLARAEFLRYGSMHRNTYVDAPQCLNADLSLKGRPGVFLAGQITGVEGYVESAACGLWLGLLLAARAYGRELPPPPPTTALGALLGHLQTPAKHFTPSNVHFGLMPALEENVKKKSRKAAMAERGQRDFSAWLALAFLLYVFLGKYIPGAFGHVGFPVTRVADHMFWGSQGLLGVGVGVSATYIFLFVLFAAFLRISGFSEFINDLALTLVGRTAGGPAKVSVIASALMGMINGSALANVATTGAVTIPLMKKTGYKAEFAGAVEAVASTGGQFAPPIMGAVGFIMAEFLGVSYTTVMIAAAMPAFLYYLGLIMAVHFEARKLGLKGLSREYIPDAMAVMCRRGHLFLPLAALLALMFMGFTPLFAAAAAIFVTVAASWFSRETRMGPRRILQALEEGARGAVGVGVSCVVIGIIIGSVSLTGLGLTFGFEVLKYVGQEHLYLGGVFVMAMSTILGMGVPGVAAYVIVAAVAVPVLTGVGVQPLAAHMFCLFYACLSNITPPVAMSSYVAAGIAHSNETKTSLIAVRLGLQGFILPFFFLNNPLLLCSGEGTVLASLWAFFTASLGVSALAAGLGRWLRAPCTVLQSILFLVGAVFTIDPGLCTDAAGLVLIAAAAALNMRGGKVPGRTS
ncbi:MAG: methylenetetrahydrofolate--tRNA-(uracil(54)-C(5))-methyltransferase (FADH(2)-oxidizing) TrmFO, partial [Mailhella sp.]|nr:methylenetetrahydrofolate--tRNA-(uracil(54)-C(5))-methyltransferase (FADH(2)-oxidizing) TrmFO [Mailhella sp.]